MIETLSMEQARRLVLHAQRLPPKESSGSAAAATLSALEHLGYAQIDTISAVQRAHHHVLWCRNPHHQPAHLDQLVEEKKVFEYWAHAAAYLPMRDYRFSLPRKLAIARGEQSHWFRRDERLIAYVRDRIAAAGPLMARDFDRGGPKKGGWGAKPAKQALETLFMQGDLMISRRVNFHKVYDLAERVLPEDIDVSVPTPDEHARFLIVRYLRANGIGRAAEIAYLLKKTKPRVEAVLREMTAAGELLEVRVAGRAYAALPESMRLLQKPLARARLMILSPFDNLLIQRQRMRALFDFDYQLECYLPAAKRTYGYFVLPILWDGRLAARMDCKADRKAGVLRVIHLVREPWVEKADAFRDALEKELAAFARFNGCKRVRVSG